MALTWNVIDPTDDGILEKLSKRVIRDGEKALMLAVLENAIADSQKYVLATDKKGKGLFDAAEAWILETDSPSFFSFNNICEHLDFDPHYIRKGFMRWKEAKLSQPKECTDKLNPEAA
jgi:hypothetical protein